MNVTEIELTNFGSWEHVRLPIEPGLSLISGANGTGKSTLLSAMRFGLYGISSDAGRLIRRGTDKAVVRLWVDTDHGALIVERTIRRSGAKAVVSLAVWDADETNLSAATTSETQERLEVSLGVSLHVLEASAWSMQGNGAAFCEAKPTERKKILADVLDLGVWAQLHVDARANALDAKRSADAARGALALVDGARHRLFEAQMQRDHANVAVEVAQADETLAEEDAARLAAEAEAAREARRQHQAAVEAAERARADHQRATAERAAADEALDRAKDAAANAPSVFDALVAAEASESAVRVAETLHAAAVEEAQRYVDAIDRVRRELADLQAERESGDCARCGQPLHADVTERLLETTRTFRALEMDSPPAPEDSDLRAAREAAQAAQTRLAEAETIQALAGSIDAAQQRARDAMDREMETAEGLRTVITAIGLTLDGLPGDLEIEERHELAAAAAGEARMAHREAAAALATAKAAAQQAERDAAAETTARERVADAERLAATESILAAGFGPSGTPALILENSALPALEAEANRVLGELNAPARIELRSQKVLRSRDDVADTLDIVVLMDALEAPYETLSGGERTRVALALRAALTRLLVSKRGARVRLLVVDEPAGLDSTGCEQLALVLEEFVQAGVFETIILVTHQAELADQIARVIRVERAPGGDSRLATRVAATAPMQEAVDA